MTYLNFLQKRLRAVARRVFPSDPEQCVYLTNMNKYTRLYLRRIVYSAGKDPFKLKITNQQLARLCCVPLKKFLLWFRHDYHLPKVFRRVRYFLREIIIMNIYEDRGDLYILRSDGSIERPVDRPSGRTMAWWTQQMNPIREEHRNQGPPITNLSEAMEMIEWMQAGYSSSDSSESDCESIGVGEDPDEGRSVNEINSDTEESPALNGDPVIINNDELLKIFENIDISSDTLNDHYGSDDASSSDMYHSSNQNYILQVII